MQQQMVAFSVSVKRPCCCFSCFLLLSCISSGAIPFRRRWRRNLSWRGSGRIDGRVLLSSSSLPGLGNGVVIRSRLLIIWPLIGWLLIRRLLINGPLIGRLLVDRLLILIHRLLITRLCCRPVEWPVVHGLAGRRRLRSLIDRPACRLVA